MTKKERGPLINHKPRRAWARNGLSKIKGLRRPDGRPVTPTGFTESEPDPRRQMTWNSYFTKLDTPHVRGSDELRGDGGIRSFSSFA